MNERIISNENILQQESSSFRGDIFKLDKKILGENIITCQNISKIYILPGSEEKVVALKSISLSEESEFYPVKRGEFIIIRGPSGNKLILKVNYLGGGKTTLLNILGTLDSEFEGKLHILNTEINNKSDDDFLSKLKLQNIGFVFQTFNLISTMTAKGNISICNVAQKMLSYRCTLRMFVLMNKKLKDLLSCYRESV